jgi:Saxitoxin biosynthesis operon protein SxtJ
VQKAVKTQERSFGLSVGAVLCAVGLLLLWRGRPVRAEIVGALGVLLFVPGLVYPAILAWPAALWWRFSLALGRINARILLTLIFGVVFIPMSIFWRLTGKDPLGRRRDRFPGWSPYPESHRNSTHYTRMY